MGDAGTGRMVYRPLPARIGSGVFAVFAGWWTVALLLGDDRRQALVVVPLLVAAGVLVHALFWRPAVVVDDDAVELVNVLRDVRVPWPVLEAVETRYALTLVAAGRRYASWAAAAPGRPAAPRGRDAAPAGGPSTVAASRDLHADSGAAAFMVEQRWGAVVPEPRRGTGTDPVTVRRRVWPAIVVGVALALAALATTIA